MKHITIIVPDGQSTLSTVACIVGTYEIFIRANGYWKKNGKRELFKIELAGVSEAAEFDNGLLTIKPQASISSISKTHQPDSYSFIDPRLPGTTKEQQTIS